MAKFNEILAGRYNRFLQKLFQLKGGPPSAQLASEVMPTFAFFTGVENRWLEGWNRFGMSQNIAAVAANASGVRLRNPVGSNLVAVLEYLSIITTLADFPFLDHGALATDLGTIQSLSASRFDPRGSPQPNCIMSGFSPTTQAGLSSAAQFATGANALLVVLAFEEQELTILPGEVLQVRCQVVNNGLTVNWWWRERSLEDSELK